MQKMEAAQVIDTIDMIGMGVGEEDGVNPVQAFAQGLPPQIGGGINQDVPPPVPDQKGSPRSPVLWVVRTAYPAPASHHGNPG
jgi:hypothetical protein